MSCSSFAGVRLWSVFQTHRARMLLTVGHLFRDFASFKRIQLFKKKKKLLGNLMWIAAKTVCVYHEYFHYKPVHIPNVKFLLCFVAWGPAVITSVFLADLSPWSQSSAYCSYLLWYGMVLLPARTRILWGFNVFCSWLWLLGDLVISVVVLQQVIVKWIVSIFSEPDSEGCLSKQKIILWNAQEAQSY